MLTNVSEEVLELVKQSKEERNRKQEKAKELKRRNDILTDTVDVPKELETLEKIDEEGPVETEGETK